MAQIDIATASPVTKHIPRRKYRPDLHGIRGLAILGVVLFHLFGDGRVSGGIDIFLAVSGFLFTAMLLRETAEHDGKINFLAYFGRLFRRIFAPAATVIITTTLAGLIILPFTMHPQMLREAVASMLYYENLELINSQLSYDAAGPETSVFQHFWSLSVQGQFYLVIPFVILALFALARKRQQPVVWLVAGVLLIVLAVSIVWAVVYGQHQQEASYLATTTRLWQLAFGGLLALVIDHIRLSSKVRYVLGWLGLAMVLVTGFLFDGAELFPGPWAGWPLLGLALVLIAAPQDSDPETGSVTRFLDNRFFNWIGDHSYALYLWHWPLLIFYLAIRDREAIGVRGGLVILGITIILAVLTNIFVERPLRLWGTQATGHQKHVLPIALGMIVMLVFSNSVWNTAHSSQQGSDTKKSLVLDDTLYPGALSTLQDAPPEPEVETFQPELMELAEVQQDYVARDCRQDGRNKPGSYELTLCEDPNPPKNPTATIVLAPDSHAGHWEQTFRVLAEKYDWEVILAIKSGCNFSGTPGEPGDDYCHLWNDNFMEYLAQEDIDLVVAPGTRLYGRPAKESIADGAQNRWEQIAERDTPLLLIRGLIRPSAHATRDCLAENNSPEECGGIAGDAHDPNPLETLDLASTTRTIDMNPYVCPGVEQGRDTVCPAVVGNVVVWYDNSHITPQYATTLAPIMEDQLQEEFPELFQS